MDDGACALSVWFKTRHGDRGEGTVFEFNGDSLIRTFHEEPTVRTGVSQERGVEALGRGAQLVPARDQRGGEKLT